MDAREFLRLRETHKPRRWNLDVGPGICTDGLFLFGGSGLGAAIAALGRTTGRPVVWAVAQYLSYARPPEIMDIDVTVAVAGHQTTQAKRFEMRLAVGRDFSEFEGTRADGHAALWARVCRIANGRVNLWAQDGTLPADASQSCVVRPWRDAKLASLAAVRGQDRRRTRPA